MQMGFVTVTVAAGFAKALLDLDPRRDARPTVG
jgi:hypothetical protein